MVKVLVAGMAELVTFYFPILEKSVYYKLKIGSVSIVRDDEIIDISHRKGESF